MLSGSTTNSQLQDIAAFYGWWQFAVCFFAFLALMAIWYHIGRRQGDFGQVWLALSILCWAFSGLTEIWPLGSETLTSDSSINPVESGSPSGEGIRDGLRSVFSLLNSLFILLALPWFRYLPKPFEGLIKSRFWPYSIGIPFAFALLPTLQKMFMGRETALIRELDVYYALLTLVFLGFVLWESFRKRRLPLLGWLSILTVGVTLMAQLYKLMDNTLNLVLFSAIFKTALIMLFFALALSWVKELTETLIPGPQVLQIIFPSNPGRDRAAKGAVLLKGFPGEKIREVSLSPALFRLLRTFAERRLHGDAGWLEIKPKHYEGSKSFDINDHNELKRLLTSLLDGLFGKGAWSRETHFEPLKSTLFEWSEHKERRIRLRLPPGNIRL